MRSLFSRELAAKLRHLRIERGLTTRELASRCGFSQSKVVRIESNQSLLKPHDAERMLHELGVLPSLRGQLLSDATEVYLADRWGSRRNAISAVPSPAEFEEIESGVEFHRIIRGSLIPLHFQTVSYIQAVYAADALPLSESEFVGIKLRRQANALFSRRDHRVLIDEAVLLRQVLPHRQWIEQLHAIRDRLLLDCVVLGIIPIEQERPGVVPSWHLLGGEGVLHDDFGRMGEFVAERTHLARQRARFDQFSSCAVHGRDALELVDQAIRRFETGDTIDLRAAVSGGKNRPDDLTENKPSATFRKEIDR